MSALYALWTQAVIRALHALWKQIVICTPCEASSDECFAPLRISMYVPARADARLVSTYHHIYNKHMNMTNTIAKKKKLTNRSKQESKQ